MDDRTFLITIAIPTYNGAKTIRNLLDILIPQIDENEIEIIISDNCSTDDTPQIIEEYRSKYPYIKCLESSENLGADVNFLKCMLAANGKFTMLVSDDDIVVENAISKIVSFLKMNPQISLAYLSSISFKDNYIDISHCRDFIVKSMKPRGNVVTTNKKEFFKYIGRQWGFTSCFLWNTKRCQQISNPEKFFGTYWLQSYIHILCSDRKDDVLGIVEGPCIAVGAYGNIYNFDAAEVEGVFYKEMLDFAISNGGYDRKQLYREWLWKVCYIGKRSVILEKSAGIHMTSKRKLFSLMKCYPYAWLHLFPALIVPGFLCRIAIQILRKVQGRAYISYVNRSTY